MVFKAPKTPTPTAPPAAPTVDQAAVRAEDENRLRRRRGRSPYVLAGRMGSQAGTVNVGTKSLTGE